MTSDELARVITEQPSNYAWFLGAGSSRSSGLPTAEDIIWDLKQLIYCRNENRDSSGFDTRDEALKKLLQSYFDSQHFPSRRSPEEYGEYFKAVFGVDKLAQKEYIGRMLAESKVNLSVGSRVLGALLAKGHCNAVFTTNFDNVIERAFETVCGSELETYDLDSDEEAARAWDREEAPFVCKLHGDFRQESIKNLPEDLVTQNQNLSKCMVDAGSRFGFIIAGYSGRDKSVMQIFEEIVDDDQPFPFGLYWTDIKGSKPSPGVSVLLSKAKEKHIPCEFVAIDTYDTFMLKIWKPYIDKEAEVDKAVRRGAVALPNISIPGPGHQLPMVRFNALPIVSMPRTCLALSLGKRLDRDEFNATQSRAGGRLILGNATELLCWGTDSDVIDIFGVTVARREIEIDTPCGAVVSNRQVKEFVEKALSIALARDKPLLPRRDGHRSVLIIDSYSGDLSSFAEIEKQVEGLYGTVPKSRIKDHFGEPIPPEIRWVEALRLSIDMKYGSYWLVLEPDVWIWPREARKLATTIVNGRKSGRYNRQYDGLLTAWIRALLPGAAKGEVRSVTPFQEGDGVSNPLFGIGSRTAFSRE